MSDVWAAIALWHEHFEGATDQLLPAVAEQLLGLAVDLDDRPIPIDDHDRVWGRFEESVEEPAWRTRGGV